MEQQQQQPQASTSNFIAERNPLMHDMLKFSPFFLLMCSLTPSASTSSSSTPRKRKESETSDALPSPQAEAGSSSSTPKKRKLSAAENIKSPQSTPQKSTFDRPPSMAYVDDLEALQCTLRYRFKDVQILENALTFKSEGTSSFERLEFLGDGILGNLIETFRFQHFENLKL